VRKRVHMRVIRVNRWPGGSDEERKQGDRSRVRQSIRRAGRTLQLHSHCNGHRFVLSTNRQPILFVLIRDPYSLENEL